MPNTGPFSLTVSPFSLLVGAPSLALSDRALTLSPESPPEADAPLVGSKIPHRIDPARPRIPLRARSPRSSALQRAPPTPGPDALDVAYRLRPVGYDATVAVARREERLRRILEQLTRRQLLLISHAAKLRLGVQPSKGRLVSALAGVESAALARGLSVLPNRDLQMLCERIGYSTDGSSHVLANRIVGAANDPAVRPSRWRPFVELRTWARSLNLSGQREWYALMREARPGDVPAAPSAAYRDEWTSWGDFLGTGNPARHLITYRPFAKARAFARSLRLPSLDAWRKFCRARSGNRRVLPPDIPSAPYQVYDEWVSVGDWLGTGRIAPKDYEYRSYTAARAFVRKLGIRGEDDWRSYCRGDLHARRPRPSDIPSNPSRVYRGRGWTTWGAFTGSGFVAAYKRKFRPFSKARGFVREQGIKNSKQWRAWCRAGKRPADIPGAPDETYRGKGWVSWGDFFGTGWVHPSRRRRPTFAAARAFVRKLGLQTRADYDRAWHAGKIPPEIPFVIEKHPDWRGWADFLGRG